MQVWYNGDTLRPATKNRAMRHGNFADGALHNRNLI